MTIKKLLIFCMCIFVSIATSAQTYSTESFDDYTNDDSLGDGVPFVESGLWIDGGSNAYLKSSEKYNGNRSFVISKGLDGNPDKPYYSSIYTKSLDFSKSTAAELKFKYLVTNKLGIIPTGSFSVEISIDGGENFTTLETYNMVDQHVVSNTGSLYVVDCKAQCSIDFIDDKITRDQCRTSCDLEKALNIIPVTETQKYWTPISIAIAQNKLSNMTLLRIKSYLASTDVDTSIFLDNIEINYKGISPDLSENTINVSAIIDPITSGRVLLKQDGVSNTFEDFDAVDDWGIWQDGGRNVFITNFNSVDEKGNTNASSFGVGLRSFFSGKSNGIVDGVQLGYQKSTYSSIIAQNLDLTTVGTSVDLSFSFATYNMKLTDPTNAELLAAGNVNLADKDGVSVLGYAPGPDRVEISISTDSGYTYKPFKTLTYGEHFINGVRQQVNFTIPVDFLATDNESDPETILNTETLTTTTQIKIQCFSDTDRQLFYIDQIGLYTAGTRTSPRGSPIDLDWASYNQTVLTANINLDTYDHLNSQLLDPDVYANKSFLGADAFSQTDEDTGKTEFIPGIYGAVEHSDDCGDHGYLGNWNEGKRHIAQEYDNALGKYVFSFYSHLSADTERCRYYEGEPVGSGKYQDRQRVEIKTYDESRDDQKSLKGETHFYAWKMKLPTNFKASNKFTHLHQIKPAGGEHKGMPTFTLTATSKVDENDVDTNLETNPGTGISELKLRYAGLSESQVTIATIDLDKLKGKWIQFVEKIYYEESDKGRYEIVVYDPINGSIDNPLLSFESYSLQTWKIGQDHTDSDDKLFARPKWGVYRSVVEDWKLQDEIIGFTDFTLLEVTNKNDGLYGDITKFAKYAENITSDGVVDNESPTTGNGDCSNIPSEVVNLNPWKITWPIDASENDSAGVISYLDRNNKAHEWPDDNNSIIGAISGEHANYLYVNSDEVIFRAHAGGATTENSNFPRTELRQTPEGGNNYWNTNDYQKLDVKVRVLNLPSVKPEVSFMQIKGDGYEPLRIEYRDDSQGLHIVKNEKTTIENILPYTLSDQLHIIVEVENDIIKVNITNETTGGSWNESYQSEGNEAYFKLGCYLQTSNALSSINKNFSSSPGDNELGEVAVKEIELTETYKGITKIYTSPKCDLINTLPSGNLALLEGASASQSSVLSGRTADLAIDGNTNGRYGKGSVTRTEGGNNQWWEVALDESYTIGDIVIYNRTDSCCINRLENIKVTVFDSERNTTYVYESTEIINGSLTINANGALGNYIRINQGGSAPLTLAEVEVYAGEYVAPKEIILFVDYDATVNGMGAESSPFNTISSAIETIQEQYSSDIVSLYLRGDIPESETFVMEKQVSITLFGNTEFVVSSNSPLGSTLSSVDLLESTISGSGSFTIYPKRVDLEGNPTGDDADILVINSDETENDAGFRLQTKNASVFRDWTIAGTAPIPAITSSRLRFGLWEGTTHTDDNEVELGTEHMSIGILGDIIVHNAMTIGTETLVAGTALSIAGPAYMMTDVRLTPVSGIVYASLKESYLLMVESGILSENYAIASPDKWMDAVFKKEYELPSLQSVEHFIKTNGHLPNLKTEEEIKSEGYDLHEMKIIFLQKIEEMTLYILENEKLIERLELLQDKRVNQNK